MPQNSRDVTSFAGGAGVVESLLVAQKCSSWLVVGGYGCGSVMCRVGLCWQGGVLKEVLGCSFLLAPMAEGLAAGGLDTSWALIAVGLAAD